MYTGLLCATAIISSYFILMALLGNRCSFFNLKNTLCLILGAILGIFLSAPVFEHGKTYGYVAFGISISIMYLIFYIAKFPKGLKKFFTTIGKVLRPVLIIAAIITITFLVLHLSGI